MSLFVEATRHNFAAGTEDRLTQVVVSAFNSNVRLKRIFFSSLGIKFDPKAVAYSQVHVGDSRPDIKLLSGNQWKTPIAVIESKTESQTKQKQLKSHKAFRADHHVLILKYREPIHVKAGWTVAYWSDLALLVEQEIARIEDEKSFDYILFISLIDFFREYGFMKNSIITKKHLESVGRFLNTVRFQKNPRGSLDGVAALQEVTEALELALEILKVDGELNKELSEVGGIRPSTTLNYMYHQDDIERLAKRKKRGESILKSLDSNARKFLSAELTELSEMRRHRANNLSLEKTISLKKKKRNGVRLLSLSLEQVDDQKTDVVVRLAVVNKEGDIATCLEWHKSSLPKGGLTAAAIAKSSAKEWSKWLKKKRIDW